MHLKSRLTAVLLLAVLLVAIVLTKGFAFHKEDIDESGGTEPSEKKETIHFWYSDESLSDYINSAAVAFGEQYDVRVLPQYIGEREYLEAIQKASLEEGAQYPDAYLVGHDFLEKAYLAGLAVPVDPAGEVVIPANFPQAALSAVSCRGKYVAYPLYYETTVLLYNETYLEEWADQQAHKPDPSEEEEEDWENMEEVPGDVVEYDEETIAIRFQQFMAKSVPATIGDILQMADSFDPPAQIESIFSWDVSDIFYNYHFVGNYMIVGGDSGDDRNKIDVDNQQVKECLQIYKDLNQFFSIESKTVRYENVLQDFLDGKVVFAIVTTDALAAVEQAVETGTFPYEYGLAVVPDPSEKLKGRSLSTTGTVAINGYSSHQQTASRFADFLTGEYAVHLYERTGKMSANLKIDTDKPAITIFMEEYKDSIPLPKMMESSNFWIRLEVLFAKVWNGADAEEMLTELAQQLKLQLMQ